MANQFVNGVDVEALGGLIGKMTSDPRLAQFEFRCSKNWEDGAVVKSTFTATTRMAWMSCRGGYY